MRFLVALLLCTILYSGESFARCSYEDAECLAPLVVPQYDNPEREWSSYNGEAFSFNDRIVVRTRFDQGAVDILRSNSGFGLEVDVVLAGKNRDIALKEVRSTFPASAKVGKDTPIFDSITNAADTRTVGLHILKPSEIVAEEDYYSVFIFEDNLPDDSVIVQNVLLQLTIDLVVPLTTTYPIQEKLAASGVFAYIGQGIAFFDLITEIRKLDQYQYFVLESDPHQVRGLNGTYDGAFSAYPSGSHAMCWYDKNDSTHCTVGQCVVGKSFHILDLIGISSANASSCSAPNGTSVPANAEVYGSREYMTGGTAPPGGTGEGTTNPNLTADLDLYNGNTRVDDKTHPYGFPLTLKARIKVKGADASDTAEAGKDQIEVDFWWRIRGSANWNKAGERQYTNIDNLDEGDTHSESVIITPTYQTGTVIETKVCIDTEDEVRESNEGDNCDEEFTTLTDPPPQKPDGRLDKKSCSNLSGWARDPDSTSPLRVQVRRNGEIYHTITANDYRGDLPFSDQYHGYHYTIPPAHNNGREYTWLLLALDDRVNGYAGNTILGSYTRRCYPSYAVKIFAAERRTSTAYFHTKRAPEYNGLDTSHWSKRGADFVAFDRYVSGTRPIYISYKKSLPGHLLSRSSTEGSRNGYTGTKVAFYCYTSQRSGTEPLYRMYHTRKRAHRGVTQSEVSNSTRDGFHKESTPLCYVYPLS